MYIYTHIYYEYTCIICIYIHIFIIYIYIYITLPGIDKKVRRLTFRTQGWLLRLL